MSSSGPDVTPETLLRDDQILRRAYHEDRDLGICVGTTRVAHG